ncbi:MAG: MoaD/ThiS family protein [Hyphomicrobiaceae bacterium]|nr:MoaD/ThiS family protein [Hyphomicrobiaceae bacterium]
MHGINLPTVTVILTPALLRLFPTAEARSRVSAASVDHMLDELDKRWPGIRDRIADTSPAIRRHITVFVDGERARLDTPLRDDGTVYILTAVSGG